MEEQHKQQLREVIMKSLFETDKIGNPEQLSLLTQNAYRKEAERFRAAFEAYLNERHAQMRAEIEAEAGLD